MLAAAIIVILGIAGFVSYFISSGLYRRLIKLANKNAMLLSILTFVGSFILITVAIAFIILYNMPFER